MTRVFFTRHGLKTLAVAFACVLLGLGVLGGIVGLGCYINAAQDAWGPNPGDYIERSANWLGIFLCVVCMLPGITVVTAWCILDEQKKKENSRYR